MPQLLKTSSPLDGSVEAKPRSGRILEIDGLRGIAILLVITKHLGFIPLPGEEDSSAIAFLNRFFPSLSGVDLFFVVTGYLLGRSLLALLDSPHYYSSFYFRRWLRTIPLYYILLLVFSIIVLVPGLVGSSTAIHFDWPFGTPWAMVAYGAFVQNFWMAAAASLGPHWLGITWSLAVQEQFYLPLPWIVRFFPSRLLGCVLTLLVLIAPACRLLVVCLMPAWRWNAIDCLICCRTDTLAIGVLAAWLVQIPGVARRLERAGGWFSPAVSGLFVGFATLTYLGYTLGTPTMYVAGHSYLAVLYVLLIFLASFSSSGVIGAALRLAPLRELGRISYGLFLFHMLIYDLVRYYSGISYSQDGWLSWIVKLDAFLLTVVVAELSWHFVEKPLIAWSRR
jgi:peptidoglycan/LPS O-acetylase OafA/YrhL